MRLRLLALFFVLCFPTFAQQTATTTAASDPHALAVVQAAIAALGGATTIGPLQSW